MKIFSNVLAAYLVILFYCLRIGQSLDNGLAKTPPMGWLSWERFRCETNCQKKSENDLVNCISEELFIQIADTIIKRGYKKAGYNRINIDDCWSKKRREVIDGKLLPNYNRFPNGIKYLSEYMHKHDLKLGIYQNFGRRTCMGYPGIMGHMEQDIKTFADWDVDMIKLDACFIAPTKLDKAYLKFRQLVDDTKKPILLSCSWPYYQLFASKVHIVPNWDLISMNCNIFRVFHDVSANWKIIQMIIDFMGDHQQIFHRVTGVGSWPDPDMLMIGNPGLNIPQAEAQMAIWCILPAPLFMSNDPRNMEKEFENILLNTNAIAINQDVKAIPGERIFHNETMDIWRRLLSDNRMALVVLNRQLRRPLQIKLPIDQLLTIDRPNPEQSLNVLNIFTGEIFSIQSTVIPVNATSKQVKTFLDISAKPTGVAFFLFSIQV